jgi:hypothetical protein
MHSGTSVSLFYIKLKYLFCHKNLIHGWIWNQFNNSINLLE